MQSTGRTILSTTQLGLRRSERWLFQNLNFSLEAGQVIQVTGANGSGKTSLLRCLCGLLPQQSGRYEWLEVDEEPIIPLFFGHSPAVKTDLTVLENLLYHPVNGKFYSEEAIEEALFEVGLGHYLDRMARHLSAGQTRRIGLARLLFADSECWVLDEPYTALDVDACHWLESVISRYAQQGGSVLITSHQPMTLDVPVTELRITEDMSHV